MRTVPLGQSRVRVTGLGFGAAEIGNLFTALDEDAARATVDAAWHAGVRYFDTAPHYGLGLSERRLGAALAGRPRAEFTVSTKVGRILLPSKETAHLRDSAFDFDVAADHRRVWDFSADGVRRSLESSVDRLGLDHIDIALLHDPDDHWPQAIGEAYPALHELRAQGVVGAIGVGMNQWQLLERFVRETDIDTVMLAGRFTLLEQSALISMLPACEERGVSVLAAGVFNSGLLATDAPTQDTTYDYRPPNAAVFGRATRITEVCAAHGVTLAEAAIAYVARHPAVASVVLGMRTADQVRTNARRYGTPVPDALWPDLIAAGLLPAERVHS